MRIASAVEGHGEVAALPALLRRLGSDLAPSGSLTVLPPFRVKRDKIVKPRELERTVDFLARKAGPDGAVLVLLDADDDCPATLGPSLLTRALAARADARIAVVLANREFEAWFLAALPSIAHLQAADRDPVGAPESLRSPKAWLARNLQGGYSPAVDQPRIAAIFDLEQARSAPSFEKLVRDFRRLLASAT